MINQHCKKRMPQLVVDEVLLLVDTYFQCKMISNSQERRLLITKLSENIRRLPFFPEEKNNPKFRSFAGMQMCLSNVAYLDPENKSKFGHGSALQKKIFDYYCNRQEDLHKLVLTIIEIANEAFPIDYSFSDSVIGMLVPSYHIYLERRNKTVQVVKRHLIDNSNTTCRVCNRDLSEIYVDGDSLMEIHLDMPLFMNKRTTIISPSLMIAICPSCHKLAHADYDAFEVSNLIKHLKN